VIAGELSLGVAEVLQVERLVPKARSAKGPNGLPGTPRFSGARFFARPTASVLAADYFIQTVNDADKILRGSTCDLFTDSFCR